MWQHALKFAQKAGTYAAIAFSGHELGSAIEGDKTRVEKETTIIKSESNEQSSASIKELALLVILMIAIGIIFAIVFQIYKCVNKNTKSTTSIVNNNASAEEAQPQPPVQPTARRL